MAHPNDTNVFNHLTPRREQTYLAAFRIFESDHLVYAKPAWRNLKNNLKQARPDLAESTQEFCDGGRWAILLCTEEFHKQHANANNI